MNTKHLIPFSVVALAAMVCAPVSGLAQSILLSAGNFTLLGGTAITSTGVVGTTIRNGNVGLAPGATTGITGFPPAVVIGGAIIATSGITAQARLDLITASVGLAGMPSNANMSTVDLGGKTLAPGVYTFNGAAAQTGALVLDAQGQNNVAWVFQIGTALTTSINSTVTFINLGSNGGKDLGVFWNAGSAVNIGANNTLVGNYLSGTSITFGGLSGGGGRALALAGVSLDNNIVDARGGLGGGDYSGGLYYSLSGAVLPSGPGGSGTITIAPGAMNGGLGTLSGNVANSGILSPGVNNPSQTTGQLTVAGSFVQTSTGRLVIQIASGSSFDQLNVTGTGTLAGTLQVDLLNGYNPVGLSFPVVIAAGGLSGTFATLTGSAFTTNRAALGTAVTYSPTTVTVAFVQLPFAGFALTPNQSAVGNAAQASPALTAALDAVPLAGQMPAALNALSPQGYEVWSDIAFANATALSDGVIGQPGATPGHNNYYVQAGQRRSRTQRDLDVGASTYTSSNLLVGADHAVDASLTFGGFVGRGSTNAGLGTAGSSTRVTNKLVGARAIMTQGDWFTHAVVAYSFDDYRATRAVAFADTTAVATSSTRGHQWLADVTVGRRFTTGDMTLAPFAGLLLSRWEANGFSEAGAGAFDAALGRQSARSLRSQVGLQGELDWKFAAVTLRPHFRAAWLHELSDRARAINVTTDSVNYRVTTRGPQRDSALLGAGVDLMFNPRAALYAEYTAQSDGRTNHLSDWRLGVSVQF